MNSSLEPPRTVVFALCGSFCTFETVLPQITRLRACGWEVLPMLSYAASALDTRFGRAADWKQRLEEATGHRPLEDLREAEPLGPKHMAQALVIAPCTGTTMALLAAGISATPVTLAAKSMLRGGRPVVIGVAALRAAGSNVGCRSASSCFASTFITACSLVQTPSSTRSTATLSAACAVRLPLRVCSM